MPNKMICFFVLSWKSENEKMRALPNQRVEMNMYSAGGGNKWIVRGEINET